MNEKELEEIRKKGDEILTQLKNNPNHISTMLSKDEVTSYNTGFHSGFILGYKAKEEEAVKFAEWLTKIDSPYAVLYGGFPERWATEEKDYTTAELYKEYLTQKQK